MALGMVTQGLGLGVVGDAAEAVLAEAQDPGEEELSVRSKGSGGEGGCESLDDGFQGSYHSPHEGFLPGERIA